MSYEDGYASNSGPTPNRPEVRRPTKAIKGTLRMAVSSCRPEIEDLKAWVSRLELAIDEAVLRGGVGALQSVWEQIPRGVEFQRHE